ncbi:MAG TPA: hypothetical protein VJJ26_00505 [Candidatus Babeliales bacterium]|nr:hypothetical protein [Candidatus Babeliales bacterium]
MNQKIIYCCYAIEQEINDPRVFINYNPKYRESSINTTNKHVIRLISNCPWCGKGLPQSLRDEWFDILEKEYQLDDPWDKNQALLVPEEFKTDEWWKKRGL